MVEIRVGSRREVGRLRRLGPGETGERGLDESSQGGLVGAAASKCFGAAVDCEQEVAEGLGVGRWVDVAGALGGLHGGRVGER